MSSISRPTYTQPVPAGAVVVEHEGRAGVWLRKRGYPEPVFAALSKKPGRVLVPARHWYVNYHDAAGRVRKAKASTDRAEAEKVRAEIDAKVSRQRAGLGVLELNLAAVRGQQTEPQAPRVVWGIPGLVGLDLRVLPFASAVYFLCRDGAVVYVGQSFNFLGRVVRHFETKRFDSVFFLPMPVEELAAAEDRFIRQYEPEYNRDKHGRLVVGRPNRESKAGARYRKPRTSATPSETPQPAQHVST